jgi:hypothetical protein
MIRPHPILNKDYQLLRQTFDSIANEIGRKLGRNPTFDERGLTDELLDLLQTELDIIKLSKYYIKLNVNKPSEKKTGADILLRIIIKLQDVSFDRYVLLQAKKYIASSGRFSETEVGNKHLSGQITKMHTYNPEFSYLLLYSTNSNPVSNAVVIQTYFHFINFEELLFLSRHYDELLFLSSYYSITSIQTNSPLTILRSKTWEKFANTDPSNLLKYSETFTNFVLDDLVTGKIGKEWDDTIEKAAGEFSIMVTLTIGQG